ncbi:Zinc finger CCCH-type antiviral [Mactra antiquata]
MADESTDPIIIGSDDESDNDDVVLIKEEIEVDSEDCIFLSETKPPQTTDVVISTKSSITVTTSSHDSLTSLSSSASLTSCTAQISLEDKVSSDVLVALMRDTSATPLAPLDLSSKSTGIDDSQLDTACTRTNDITTSDVTQNSAQDSSFLMLLNGSLDVQQTDNKTDTKQDTSGITNFNSTDKKLDCDKTTVCDASNNFDTTNTVTSTTSDTGLSSSSFLNFNFKSFDWPDWKLKTPDLSDFKFKVPNWLSGNWPNTPQDSSTNQDQGNNSNAQNVPKGDSMQQKDASQLDHQQQQSSSNTDSSIPVSSASNSSNTVVPSTQSNVSDQKLTTKCSNVTDLTDPFKASHALLASMDLSLTSTSQPQSGNVDVTKNSQQSNANFQSSYPSSSTTLYNSLTLPLSQMSQNTFNRSFKRSVSTNDAYPCVFKSSFKDQSLALPRSPSPQGSHHLPPKKQKRCYSSSSKDYTCINCEVNVAGEKYPRCPNGHATCTKCLEERVKLVLTGRAKESVRCLSKSCDSYYPISELRRSLPAMVVEILEDKLDLEYVKYISDMIVKEAAEDMEQDGTVSEPNPSFELDERGDTRYIKKYEDCPGHWDSMDEREVNKKGYVLVHLEPGVQEYDDVVARFFESMVDHNVECTGVYRVQNPIQHKYYTVKKTEMIRDSEGFRSVLEGKLFHGTSTSTVDAICRKGFDWRLCGKHGTMYGQGSYFAVNASYSHQYTDLRRPQCTMRSSMTFGQPMSMTLPTTPSLLFPPVNVNFGQPLLPMGQNSSSHVRPMNLSHSASAPAVTQPMTAGMSHSHACAQSQSVSQGSQVFSNSGNQSQFVSSSIGSVQPGPSGVSQFVSSSIGSVQPGPSGVSGTSTLPLPNLSLNSRRFLSRRRHGAKRILPKPLAIRNITGLASTALVTNMDGPSDPEPQKACMFLASVLVGQYTVGNPKLRTPPPLVPNADQFVKRFDSCVDNKENPKIFVIFDSTQAYPEYLLEYTYCPSTYSGL